MSEKITYQDKTNATSVSDRSKQATAEDFNEIKSVVNSNAEALDQKPNFSDIPAVANNLTTNAQNVALSASQGFVIKGLIDGILALLNSDDVNLDELQEIVDYIKQNREDLQNLSYDNIAGLQSIIEALQAAIEANVIAIAQKPNFSDIPSVVNNLTTNAATAALSAAQGVVLKGLIDGILALLNSDDLNLDEFQEIVDYIKQNRETLSNLNWQNIAGLQSIIDALQAAINANVTEIDQKPDFSDIPSIANNLTTNLSTAALSAAQGVVLKGLIDGILALLDSDDLSLDEFQEIVDYIKQNRDTLSSLNWQNIAGLPEELTDIRNQIGNSASLETVVFGKLRFDNRVQDDLSNVSSILAAYPVSEAYFLCKTPNNRNYIIVRKGAFFVELSNTRVKLFFNGSTSLVSLSTNPTFFSTTDTYEVYRISSAGTNASTFQQGVLYDFDYWVTAQPQAQEQQPSISFPTLQISWGKNKRSFTRAFIDTSNDYVGQLRLLNVLIPNFSEVSSFSPRILMNRYKSRRLNTNATGKKIYTSGFKHQEIDGRFRTSSFDVTAESMQLDFGLEWFFQRTQSGEHWAMGMKKKRSLSKPNIASYHDKNLSRSYFYMNLQLELTIEGVKYVSPASDVIKVYYDINSGFIGYEWN